MYRGGDPKLVDPAWVVKHIHGHGALGDLYPNYRGGDIFGRQLGPVRDIKEGDTPSFLFLLPNGLDWCIRSPKHTNHAPRAVIEGPTARTAALGETMQLDATRSADPDGQELRYDWSI